MAQANGSTQWSFRSIVRVASRAAGAFVVFSLGSSVYTKYKLFQEYVTLPAAFYLELDLEQQALVERQSSNPVSLLASGLHQLELQSLIKVLHTAKADERVRGMMAVLGGRENFAGVAQLQELRNALLDFRFHVKGRAPVLAYSNVFGEGGLNGTGLYYLASAADKVFMPPTGCLSLLGFESTQVFVRGLLEHLKVNPQVFRREQYKAALAPLTNQSFDDDPAYKENITSLLQSLYDQVVDGIASARRVTPAAVQDAINAAPLLPQAAVAAGLLDGLLYRDQVEQLLLKQLPAEHQRPQVSSSKVTGLPSQNLGPRVTMQRYFIAAQWAEQMAATSQQSGPTARISSTPILNAMPPSSDGNNSQLPAPQEKQQQQQPPLGVVASGASHQSQQQQQNTQQWNFTRSQQKPTVAVITAAGPIMQAAGGGAAAQGDGVVEAHKMTRALRAFRENPQVRAVVLRINSPGGSAVASDMIAREVQLLKESGKPVVACMGDVAASGGYYIAAPANKILAQPGTITGSIGVIFAKLNVQDALKEFGITGDSIHLGANATWSSAFHTLTEQQKQQVERMIDATYGDFLSEVAAGRCMTREAVREVAKGRVWSGSQAVEVGLVDELGGVNRAVELAKELAGLPQDPQATVTVEWPSRRVPPVMMMLKSLGSLPGQQDPAAAVAAAGAAGWTGCTDAAGWALQLGQAASAYVAMFSLFSGFVCGSVSSAASGAPDYSMQFQQPQVHNSATWNSTVVRVDGGASAQHLLSNAALLQLLSREQAQQQMVAPPQMLDLEAVSLAYSC